MILVLKPNLNSDEEHKVLDRLHEMGVAAQLVHSHQQSVVVLKNDVSSEPTHNFNQIEGVLKVVRLSEGYSLATKSGSKTVSINGSNAVSDQENSLKIGTGSMPVVMAGPCSVESEAQIVEIANHVKAAGATVLRGGAFKPRTSPYEFQGLKEKGLEFLKQAKQETGLPVVTEVMSVSQVELVESYCDIIQVGTRNMYNYELLKEVGRLSKPVLLKRGMSATVDEFLYAAEYVHKEGNENVILCERGIRTFETKLRNTLDLSAVPLLKNLSGLPVVVDPSHATGRSALVRPMSRAAIACGADGLLIEVHSEPENSISDAEQAISPKELTEIIRDVYSITFALNSNISEITRATDELVSSSNLVQQNTRLPN